MMQVRTLQGETEGNLKKWLQRYDTVLRKVSL